VGQGQGQGQGNAIGNNPAGGRLGPGYGDRRLIVRPEAVPERQMSDHERYMRRLADRLEAVNDSVAEEAGRQHRARNWIVKDKNGREWGIAEGGVPVVAGRRIPVPIAPPINVDRDTENRERARGRQREEIDRQADDIERDRVIRERTRAIRERRDRERREREEREKGAEGGTTP
jgi:ribosomal protein L32